MTISWRNQGADTYIPAGEALDVVLAQTSHLAIGAHQDDLEIMAVHGILECYRKGRALFSGVVACDGAKSVRTGAFAQLSDEEMRAVRQEEQRAAARLGEYGAVIQLNHQSETVKDPLTRADFIADLSQLFERVRPQAIYTHSLFDSHVTHVAVALAVIEALKELPPARLPSLIVGCEVWQDLDWLCAEDKIVMDVSAESELQAELLRIFRSQIEGGKRYDLAALGRRRAHATFCQSHQLDRSSGLVYGLDLRPLVLDPALLPATYLAQVCERFRQQATDKICGLMARPRPG